MNGPPPIPSKSTADKQQRLAILALLCSILAVPALCGFYHLYLQSRINEKLSALRREGYAITTDEVSALFRTVTEKQNAARVLMGVLGKVKPRPNDPELPFMGKGVLPAPNSQLSGGMLTTIRECVKTNEVAWRLTRNAVDLPHCRFPVGPDLDFQTSLFHVAKLRDVFGLVHVRTVFYSEQDELPEVIDSVHTGLRLAEFLNDEPILVSQLVKFAALSNICATLERALSRNQIGVRELTEWQRDIMAAEKADSLTPAMLMELRMGLDCMSHAKKAEKFLMFASPGENQRSVWLSVLTMMVTGKMKRDAIFFIDRMREILVASKSSFPDALDLADEARRNVIAAKDAPTLFQLPILPGMLIPSLPRAFTRQGYCLAILRSTSAALAAEQYRLSNGRVPEQLRDLVPEFLSSVPLDPFDGQPLRFVRRGDDYSIYSVGPDREDNGGRKVSESPAVTETDVVFSVGR